MPENVLDIWHYGFTEMFKNAIDHSGGTLIHVSVAKNAATTEMYMSDNGARMFDYFGICSGQTFLGHSLGQLEDWILQGPEFQAATIAMLRLSNHTARTVKKIFDQYTSKDGYAFNTTVVPVRLAQYENDKLISRSQAKRVLARRELFQVILSTLPKYSPLVRLLQTKSSESFLKNIQI